MRQRTAYVVAIADECQLDAVEPPEFFSDRQQVAQRLTRMLLVAQPINHRLGRVAREFDDGLVLERAQHERVEVARRDLRQIDDRLAFTDAPRLRPHVNAASAELAHGRLETQTRAQRRLLEKQPHHFAAQNRLGAVRGGIGFLPGREVQNGRDFSSGGGVQREQIPLLQRADVMQARMSDCHDCVSNFSPRKFLRANYLCCSKTFEIIPSPSFSSSRVTFIAGSRRSVVSCVKFASSPSSWQRA